MFQWKLEYMFKNIFKISDNNKMYQACGLQLKPYLAGHSYI